MTDRELRNAGLRNKEAFDAGACLGGADSLRMLCAPQKTSRWWRRGREPIEGAEWGF